MIIPPARHEEFMRLDRERVTPSGIRAAAPYTQPIRRELDRPSFGFGLAVGVVIAVFVIGMAMLFGDKTHTRHSLERYCTVLNPDADVPQSYCVDVGTLEQLVQRSAPR